MAKSKQPIGVRFDEERLAGIKEREGLKTAQQVVTFLIDRYYSDIDNRIKEVVLESKTQFPAPESKKRTADKKIPPPARKTYQDYLREAETTTTPIAFCEEVRADSSLGPNQRSAIYARIKK